MKHIHESSQLTQAALERLDAFKAEIIDHKVKNDMTWEQMGAICEVEAASIRRFVARKDGGLTNLFSIKIEMALGIKL